MKKNILFFIITLTIFLTSLSIVQAATIEDIFGKVTPPTQVSNIGSGEAGISNFLTNIINLIYAVAGVIFMFMLIISAVQWITAGGDKEAVAKARSRITNAMIGLVLLALTYFFLRIIGDFTGFSFFQG